MLEIFLLFNCLLQKQYKKLTFETHSSRVVAARARIAISTRMSFFFSNCGRVCWHREWNDIDAECGGDVLRVCEVVRAIIENTSESSIFERCNHLSVEF